jgi:hypothetical protein
LLCTLLCTCSNPYTNPLDPSADAAQPTSVRLRLCLHALSLRTNWKLLGIHSAVRPTSFGRPEDALWRNAENICLVFQFEQKRVPTSLACPSGDTGDADRAPLGRQPTRGRGQTFLESPVFVAWSPTTRTLDLCARRASAALRAFCGELRVDDSPPHGFGVGFVNGVLAAGGSARPQRPQRTHWHFPEPVDWFEPFERWCPSAARPRGAMTSIRSSRSYAKCGDADFKAAALKVFESIRRQAPFVH